MQVICKAFNKLKKIISRIPLECHICNPFALMVIKNKYNCQTPDLPMLPSPAIYYKMLKVLYSQGCLFVRFSHVCDSSDVTLAFEDAQAIPPGWDDV